MSEWGGSKHTLPCHPEPVPGHALTDPLGSNGMLARQMDEAASGAAGGDDGAGAMLLQHKNEPTATTVTDGYRFRPHRVVFVLGLVSLINSLTSGQNTHTHTHKSFEINYLRKKTSKC